MPLPSLWTSVVVSLCACGLVYTKQGNEKPHIILIVADDLGWNDVPWHNPGVAAPSLARLAREGVVLEGSYVLPVCTPTRSALLTGRYPHRLGRQKGVIHPTEPVGLRGDVPLLPLELRRLGYSTHMIGKWHLGYCKWDFTPTFRGFDSFEGYYNGAEDYYTHRIYWSREIPVENTFGSFSKKGFYDFRNDTEVFSGAENTYSTYLIASAAEEILERRDPRDPLFLYLPFQSVHAPLQVPFNYTKPYTYISDRNRRTYLGMVTAMDEAVGRVVNALKKTQHYGNSVIVFTTDNGGPTLFGGNNWPLRGNKTTLWEGGTRGAAFVHSPLVSRRGVAMEDLVHVTDWFPTLVKLAGGVPDRDSDGIDQWNAIIGEKYQRTEFVYNIDLSDGIKAGMRFGEYKLLIGNPGPGDWTPPPKAEIKATKLSEIQKKQKIKKGRMLSSKAANADRPTERPSSSASMKSKGDRKNQGVNASVVTQVLSDLEAAEAVMTTKAEGKLVSLNLTRRESRLLKYFLNIESAAAETTQKIISSAKDKERLTPKEKLKAAMKKEIKLLRKQRKSQRTSKGEAKGQTAFEDQSEKKKKKKKK